MWGFVTFWEPVKMKLLMKAVTSNSFRYKLQELFPNDGSHLIHLIFRLWEAQYRGLDFSELAKYLRSEQVRHYWFCFERVRSNVRTHELAITVSFTIALYLFSGLRTTRLPFLIAPKRVSQT
jgi:hypothetical protein